MAKRPYQRKDGVSKMTSSLQLMHDVAGERFKADPSKCYQRHIRELYAETEKRAPLPSVGGARVEKITSEEAKSIILKYEWLRTMGSGTIACYGLKLNGELLGASCFGCLGGNIRKICLGDTVQETEELAAKTVCLMRGACVPWAPKNAASYLIRHACQQAFKDFGWQIFFAYSDNQAGEVGTVYQAAGWFFLGDNFRKGKYHTDYLSPDGKRLSSNVVNHRRLDTAKLLSEGWTRIRSHSKKKYVWFEGSPSERQFLKSRCRYSFLPYPKRRAA